MTATAELIRRDGIAALTTKGIALEAGCAEGTIFRHFGDKGGLVAAVLSHGLPEIYRLEALARRPPTADLVDDLTELCAAVIDFYRASYPIAASALADVALFRRYQAAHRAAGSGPRQIWELVAVYLNASISLGIVRHDTDADIEALSIVGACQNAVWVALVNGESALPHAGEHLAVRLAHHYADGLRGVRGVSST